MENKNKKTLILVQGINRGTYLKEAVKKSNFNLDNYDKIVEPDTEGVLDKHEWFKWLPLVDRLGDLNYIFDKRIKQECHNEIQKAIRREASLGKVVDIIGHSLGTLMVLESAVEADNVFFIGCPLSLLAIGSAVRKRTNPQLICDRLVYTYSPVDPICHNFNSNVKEFLKLYNVLPLVSNSGHGVSNYLDEVQVIRDLGGF